MHSNSDNIEITINDKMGKVIEKRFKLLLNRYQNDLEKVIRGSDFIIDFVNLLCYKCHKINLNTGGSYIDSLDSIKNKKATVNLINKEDNKSIQYDVTVALTII